MPSSGDPSASSYLNEVALAREKDRGSEKKVRRSAKKVQVEIIKGVRKPILGLEKRIPGLVVLASVLLPDIMSIIGYRFRIGSSLS